MQLSNTSAVEASSVLGATTGCFNTFPILSGLLIHTFYLVASTPVIPNTRHFMCDTFVSHGFHVLEGATCRAPLRCDASAAVAERKQIRSNDVVPLFYDRFEH
jgi:hypothetical protein